MRILGWFKWAQRDPRLAWLMLIDLLLVGVVLASLALWLTRPPGRPEPLPTPQPGSLQQQGTLQPPAAPTGSLPAVTPSAGAVPSPAASLLNQGFNEAPPPPPGLSTLPAGSTPLSSPASPTTRR